MGVFVIFQLLVGMTVGCLVLAVSMGVGMDMGVGVGVQLSAVAVFVGMGVDMFVGMLQSNGILEYPGS